MAVTAIEGVRSLTCNKVADHLIRRPRSTEHDVLHGVDKHTQGTGRTVHVSCEPSSTIPLVAVHIYKVGKRRFAP